jgi:hypothetical protein
MKVKLKDKETDKSTIGEMLDDGEAMGWVAEMVTDPAKLDDFVPGTSAKARSIIDANGDEKPEFPVVRVESGWSGSSRLWGDKVVESIVDQTNQLEPVGHLGHIKPENISSEFGEVQTTWLGAVAKKEPSKDPKRKGEMVTAAYFAGCNLPGAKIRGYIKGKAVRGISWWGVADTRAVPGKGVEVVGFVLKALDWAPKGREGMPSSSIVAIAGEMKEDSMDKELSQVTPGEFKEQNPNGHALLVAEAQAEQATVIGEMEEKVKEGETAKTLLQRAMEAVGVEDAEALITKITDLTTRVGDKAKQTRDGALAKLLMEKLPGEANEEKRKLVTRLLPSAVMGEMESKVEDAKDTDEAEKIVGEMLDAAFNSDEVIQGIVGEMSPPVVRRREQLRGEGSSLDNNPYVQTRERVTLGS